MSELSRRIEALLFVAHGPVPAAKLAEALDSDGAALEQALEALEIDLQGTALRLSRHADGLRLVTASEYAVDIERFLQQEGRAELSKPALETLSIVAYRGPISKSGIEAIRGVGSEATVRGLLSRGLITVRGAAKEPGRPPLYAVSAEFLDHFGITRTDELPPLEEVPYEA